MRLRATLLRPSGGLRPLASIIKGFFANGEQGVWYDPSDLSTLYQDAAGTIPVTAVEQPVGLMLDKSRGLVLGPELVSNGDFSQGGTGWQQNVTGTGDCSFSGGKCTLVAVNANNRAGVVQKITGLVVGKSYLFTWDSSGSTANGTVGFSTIGVGAFSASVGFALVSTNRFVVTATAVSHWLHAFVNSAGGTVVLDNISVRELPGNHASQITATSRPVLSARVNLLTKTEDFSHSDWAWGNKFTYEAASAPNGENTATKLTTAADVIATRSFTAVATSFEYVIYLKTGAGFTPTALVRNTTTALNLITVRTTDVSGSNQYGSWDVISLDGGWKKIKITVTGGISTGNGLVFYFGNTGLVPIGSYWYIWHPDIRPTNTGTNLPDYQRVNTATDYDTAGFPRIERFDAVDDVQNITFPVSLGSNCTVARVAQGGAVTILTGQTIGTSYQINQSHAGLIVVNRALTQSETNAVTRYFQNKGSGK